MLTNIILSVKIIDVLMRICSGGSKMLKFFNVSEEINTDHLEKRIETEITKQKTKKEVKDPCIKAAYCKKKQPDKELIKK